jgi:hypothetical protein
MQEKEPIVCTLTAADLADRQKAWLKLGSYLTDGAEISGGLLFTFKPASGVSSSLKTLVRLEADCCPWMKFMLEDAPRAVKITVTAVGDDGEWAAREAFAPLLAAAQRSARQAS